MFRKLALAIVVIVAACNPFDPPLYRTDLPNGYAQDSNGGEFGQLVKPTGPTSGEVVAPNGSGPHGRERWCNTFGWHGDFVVCELTEYADRAFVDPPLSGEYLLLDTKGGGVTYFKSREELQHSWMRLTTSPMPPLSKEHPSRHEMSP